MRFSSVFFTLLLSGCSYAQHDFEPNLIGGREIVEGFPEVIRIRSGNSSCTAAVVGPRVILTAAHCSTDQGDIHPVHENKEYGFTAGGKDYTARCTLAPSYRDGRQGVGSEDIALCKTDRTIHTRYAVLSAHEPAVGDTVTLIGYGCLRGQWPRGGNDGILRVGEAKVTKSSTKTSFHWYTEGSAALCSGDSGGPAFHHVKDPSETHYIAGVNSMGNLSTTSLLSSVPRSLKFLAHYEQKEGVQICGLSLNCEKRAPNRMCQEEIITLQHSLSALQKCLAK